MSPKNLALSNKSTQATDCPPISIKPQRLFVNTGKKSGNFSVIGMFKKSGIYTVLIIMNIFDIFGRSVILIFKFIHIVFIMLAKHIYKLTCRVMLLDTWNLRSRNPAKRRTLLIVLCLVPLVISAGCWIALNLSNDKIKVSDNLDNDEPTGCSAIPSSTDLRKSVFYGLYPENCTFFENRTSITQKLDPKEVASNLSSDQLKTIAEYLKLQKSDFMKSEIIQNSMKDYTNKLQEIRDCSNLQNELQQTVEKQQQIINVLKSDINKLKSHMKSKENIKADSDKWELRQNQCPRRLSSFLNDPNFLDKQKGLKYWLHSLFISEKEFETKVKIHDADKTGLVDYAMESMGGEIITTVCTESYTTSVIKIFGIPVWYPAPSPRIVINSGIVPGRCWAFQNFPGVLVVKLVELIEIESFSIEHISKLLIPEGNIDSAPRDFKVYGVRDLETDVKYQLGEYKYDRNGESIQYFKADNLNMAFEYIRVEITSNHGNPNYTCLYRFRVHGKPSVHTD